jgi:putative FmdB family regulatory protein
VKPSPAEELRRIEMPTYEYECKDCKKKFTLILSISEHDKTKASCPKCKGKKVQQSISAFMTKTGRKS